MSKTPKALQALLRARFATAREAVAQETFGALPISEGPVPLSAVQRRMWFLTELEPGNTAYSLPMVLRLTGRLDEDALLGAVRDLAQRHHVLRGVVDVEGPELLLRTLPASDVPVTVREIGEDELSAALDEETGRPFRLDAEPPVRAVLFRLSNSWVLALTMHHIAMDARSLDTVCADLAAFYSARCGLGGPELPPGVQYADVADREAEDPADLDWWTGYLAGLPPVLDLPTDRPRAPASTWPGAATPVAVPPELTARLRAAATEASATPFMVLMAAWQVLLGRLAGTDDLAVGVPHAARHSAAAEAAVGCFLDTLVMRADLTGDPTGRDLVARVRAGTLEVFSHTRAPFQRIVERLRPERSLSATPVFQVMLNVHDDRADFRLPGVHVEWQLMQPRTAKFDLNLAFADGGSGGLLHGWLEYRRDLFDPATAERMVRWYLALLDGMVQDLAKPVGEIPLEPVSGPAIAGARADSDPEPVHRRIERWADERPDAVAVLAADGRLTYRELERRANRLSHRLIALGVGPDQPVGILLEPGTAFVTAMLAILKAGGAYLPVDPATPAARVRGMLDTAGARIVVTEGELVDRVPSARTVVLPKALDGMPDLRPGVPVAPTHLAHIIFTSGSTGAPKGVMVEHVNLAHAVTGLAGRMPAVAGGAFAVVSTLSADLGLACLYGALLTGGMLYLPDRETVTDPQAFAAYLASHQVDVVKMVPSHLTMLAGHGELTKVLPRTLLILGGEGCPWSLLDEVRRVRPDLAVHTHYGPTEATMMSLICDVDEVPTVSRRGLIPLGRPLPNVTGRVLDAGGRPQPVGVPGELVLGGPGVSRGYAGRADLTAERFSPGRPGDSQRWYRTGDRVRVLPDGTVEFLGRADDQVKVRGYRVELGEVTSALRALDEVAEAVVLPEGEAHGRRLLSWIVPAPGRAPRPDRIRAALRKSLADYMVPAVITVLDSIPLTPNGKVDRIALYQAVRDTEAGPASALDTPAERAVAAAWQAVLGVDQVGAGDDFFALGGHSFAATRMVSRLAEATGCVLPVRAVFEHPVLRDLAGELQRRMARPGAAGPIPRRGNPEAPVRLSPAQERLWFLWRLRPDSDTYNTSVALRLSGPLDAQALCAAIRDLGVRHEVLRITVADGASGPVAVPADRDAIPVSVVDVREQDQADALRVETARPFDLAAEPPFRALVLRSGPAAHVLVLTVHHIAVDAWSWTTLLNDLASLYRARRGIGQAPEPLAVQYADVAEWQRIQPGLGGEDEHLDWWESRLSGLPARLDLPGDRPHGPATGWTGASERVVLPEGLFARLRRTAAEADCTPFMVLLTAWQSLLSRLAGTDDVPVGVAVSGRTHPGTQDMVGCFANMLVLRGDLSGDPSVREALHRTRSQVLEAFDHAHVPFERVVERLSPDRDPDSTPLFQAMLNVIDLPAADHRFADMVATEIDAPRSTARFDLELTLLIDGRGLAGAITYRTGLFDQATVWRWADWFVTLLDRMTADPGRPVLALDPLSADERSALRHAATGMPLAAERPATVVRAVLKQAGLRPSAIAVLTADGEVSYAELAESSRRVAAALTRHVRGAGEPVGVCLPRDRRLPGALLGVLRAGAAYLPLDPDHPAERLAHLASDAGVRVVLAADSTAHAVRDLSGVTVFDVDVLAAQDAQNAVREPSPEDTAYLLYTSGSTGRPKGVEVTHGNLASFVSALSASPGMGSGDVTLGVTPFTFDVFGYELWVTLASGARLALADRDTAKDGRALADWIERTGVTAATATPTTLRLLLAADWQGKSGLRMISIGEVLDPPLARRLVRLTAELWNAYGPTETTVYSTITRVTEPVGDEYVSIGRPIAGTWVHVVDRHGRPALPGTVGELWIAGAGVARGYLGLTALTADRFVTGPGGERCYRTGDLVRWRDHELEYLGRTDHQVKVRGHRIELGEIEAVLRSHPQVVDAVVTVSGAPGEQYLVGYVVPRSADEPATFEAYLRDRLPEYLVPHRWVLLPAFPTSTNGKVDRNALPEPGEPARTATAPASLMQQLVAKVWCEVLGVDDIGQEDHFFGRGGHSLAATRMVGRLSEAIGHPVSVRLVFDHPVLADFANGLERTLLDSLAGEAGSPA